MQQDRWDRIQALFESAVELTAEERQDYLVEECGGDLDLLDELRALLAADERSDDLWTRLTPDAVATSVSDSEALQQIGPYEILGRAAAGGMGIVYRALDKRLEREVALKFLPPHLNADFRARERFVAEARAASRLDHPNICVIHDIGETPDKRLYLSMPFYRGQTLEMRIATGRVPEEEAVAIARQIARGLCAAHAQDIVHRDIKPANIMLTQDNGVKILDFGVAKRLGVNLTSSGVSIGTVAYMAPEQLRGEEVDARADLWALGATLYEMLAGHRAFGGERMHEVINAVLNADSDPVAALPTDIPLGLKEILGRALESDVNARYASARAMLTELDQVSSLATCEVRSESSAGVETPRDGMARWDRSMLDELVATLTTQIGPIAPVLVKRLAKTASSLSELHEQLADHIPEGSDREAFLRRVRVSTTTMPNTGSGALGQQFSAGVSAAPQLRQIEEALTPVLGPIAGTLIRRQSRNCTDIMQLCEMLADYLSNENDKANFLKITAPWCK